jgi:hypothetical protein
LGKLGRLEGLVGRLPAATKGMKRGEDLFKQGVGGEVVRKMRGLAGWRSVERLSGLGKEAEEHVLNIARWWWTWFSWWRGESDMYG